MSFLPLPPTSHLLEINIEFICGKVTIDKAVNGWGKPGKALWVSLLTFPCGDEHSLPCTWLCVHHFLGTGCHQFFPICSSQGPCSPQTAQWCPVWCFIYCFLPSPACDGKLPKSSAGAGVPALKAKLQPKPGVSSVKAAC